MLAKADRLDGRGSIEGYNFYVPSFTEERLQAGLEGYYIHRYDLPAEKINPQTLKYSFDNGVSWFSESEIRHKLTIADMV